MQNKLSILGEIRIIERQELDEALHARPYTAVILELSAITGDGHKLSALIEYLTHVQPTARLIAMSPAPAWEEARTMFQAGVHDYVPKTVNLAELIASLKKE